LRSRYSKPTLGVERLGGAGRYDGAWENMPTSSSSGPAAEEWKGVAGEEEDTWEK